MNEILFYLWFKNLSNNCEAYVVYWEMFIFGYIGNYEHATDFLA